MGSNLSIVEALAQMEAKIAHHKARYDHHAEQEALHAEQKAIHEAEHRGAVESYESFKSASVTVGNLLVNVKPEAPQPSFEDIDFGGWRWLSKLMSLVIEGKAPDEAFGASALIQEIKERWGPKLRHRIQPRSVSSTLRRWGTTGQIRLVRDGRSHYESLYMKR